MKSNISDKDIKKLREFLKRDEQDNKSPKVLERALQDLEPKIKDLSLIEKIKKRREVQEQWQIATQKTTGLMSGFLEGLVGKDLGRVLSKKLAKADDEQVKKAEEFFKKFQKSESKKDSVTAKKTDRNKDLSSIKKSVLNIQRDVTIIKKAMTGKSNPEVKSQYYFDERMAGGGRYKDKETNKIVSKDVALKSRSESLSKAIAATDEDPMIRLADTVDQIWKSLGESTRGEKTVHERLGEIDTGGGGGFGLPSFDMLKKLGGGLRRVGQGAVKIASKVGGALKTVGGKIATAVGGVAAGASAVGAKATAKAGEVAAKAAAKAVASKEVIKRIATKVLQSTVLKTAGKSIPLIGAAVGGFFAVKKLLEGDKVGAGLEAVSGLGSAATAIPAAVASATRDVYQGVYGSFPEDDPEAGSRIKELKDVVTEVATTMISGKKQDDKSSGAPGKPPAAGAPVDTKTPTPSTSSTTPSQITPAPAPAAEPSLFDKASSIVDQAKINVGSAVSSAVSSVKSFFGMGASGNDLAKYVRLKDGSVNLNGLNPQMKERLAGLAKEYNEKTGQKIQINSGYRSPEEQAALYAKIGPPNAAPPGRSRHESGLAIDMNSADANKATELGLMAKYGFTRPVRGETWHVEPIESAKRGPTPDNPYKPGAPVAVANNGKVASPETGSKPPASVAPPSVADSGASGSAMASATPAPSQTGPLTAQSAPETPSLDLKPITSDLGASVQQQSDMLASNQMAMQAPQAPVVVNNSAPSQPNPAATPKQTIPRADARPSDSSFMRALAKDFAHPTAFTTVSMT